MKRIVLFSILFALVTSLAAPMGAAFALEEGGSLPIEGQEIVPDDSLLIDEGRAVESNAPIPLEDLKPAPDVEPVIGQAAQPAPALLSEPAVSPVVVSVETPQPPAEVQLPPQRKVYVTAFQKTNAFGFVELYNSDTKTQSINGWRLAAEFADGLSPCEILLEGYILPKTKVLLARDGMPMVSNALTFTCGDAARVLTRLVLYDGDQVVERLIPPQTDDQIWARKNTTSTYLTGTFLQDFKANETYTVTDGFWYIPPSAPSVQVLEIYVNPHTCLPPDDSTACYDYIKIKNTSEKDSLDLSNYRLRSGYSNSGASASNTTYSSVVLAPGEVRTLTQDQEGAPLSFTANDGTVWFEDVEGVVSYPTDVPPYIGSDLTANKGRSWAYNSQSGQWQWATPSPETEENDFTVIEAGKGSVSQSPELVPCGENQYRSEETNRCRNIAAPSMLTPCREGQYRSEETNRCRSLATAVASVLKPCADDQFRNPTTNRCKKIASADDVALADCGEGRERNPLTNRCRNIAGAGTLADTMPFPVEKIEEGTERFSGWWPIGIALLAGAGYGAWEWREEVAGLTGKVFGKLKK